MTTPLLPKAPDKLTQFIEVEFHAKHRKQLPALITLADRVETVHAGQEHVPAGLANLLRTMAGELEVHMKKEELILFPAMRRASKGLDAPITAMRGDHDDHSEEVARIKHLTNDLTPPAKACGSWAQLYAELGEFISDLENHIRIENDILFPHFES